MLSHHHSGPDRTFTWRIGQDFEMGRPSTLFAEADNRVGKVVAARIGGDSVMVCDGFLRIDDADWWRGGFY